MIELQKVITYPFKDEQWALKILIGIALSLVPIVNFFAIGYAYQIFKAALRKEELYMPEWDDWRDLFVNGFKVFVVVLCYFFIPMLLIFSAGALWIVSFFLYEEGTAVEQLVVIGLFLFLLGGLLYLAALVLSPMALALFARNDENFGEAFRLGEIISRITSVMGDFALAILIVIAMVFIIMVCSMIPLLGFFVSIVSTFYLSYLFYFGLFGSVCAGAFDGAE
ncbi:MAG: DUF4013 domain-containing protein [Deltaproteobacteria bacterium]|nr:DUF4013 domain-containing protein [Candidatus Zymogenaceae bacterium]